MFTDRVTLELWAGKGGNGIIAWRREKYMPKGGPWGGNGGKGASIFIECDTQLSSLEAYRNVSILKAQNGGQGGPNNRTGKNGADLILKVPCGTLVLDSQTKEVLFDLTEHKQRVLICQGGNGGKGNTHFKTATNRTPYQCTPGREGKSCHVEFELKLIADVGFVGFPNAGKSTLMAELAHIPVKIAPYPFTTLRPNLGYMTGQGGERILLADIPGIIKGAHRNKGLGFEFLRHIERTHLLLYVIDMSGMEGRDPLEDFRTLRCELELYQPELLQKPFGVVLHKVDLPEAEEHVKAFTQAYPCEIIEVSSLTGEGIPLLREFLKRSFLSSTFEAKAK